MNVFVEKGKCLGGFFEAGVGCEERERDGGVRRDGMHNKNSISLSITLQFDYSLSIT
jgi:hypothetical protein